ncbi:MAG TPA: DUF92 domain-containing protein [Terracidiphilus sp.]|nr:DUF92 domain-containing protein [Terracidiphilus sp.]
MKPSHLQWQSQAMLLIVLPAAAAETALLSLYWRAIAPSVLIAALGCSILLGLAAWRLHSATPFGACVGAILTACLMLDTAEASSTLWKSALLPVLTLLVLTSLATRLGRKRKEQLGTAEHRSGRVAAQVAANIGAAALVSTHAAQMWMSDSNLFAAAGWPNGLLYAPALAALCEAAADTVSSELGQVLNSRPRMITTMRIAPPGTDGAISLGGTLAGMLAGGIVAAVGTPALRGGWLLFAVGWAGGVFGLFFDSLLGATFERRGWLNNDAVNFLSTVSAASFALLLLWVAPRCGLL